MEADALKRRGIKRGMALARARLVLHAYDSGRSYKEIANFLEVDLEEIKDIIDRRQEYVTPEEPREIRSI